MTQARGLQIAVPESRRMLDEVPVVGWFLVAVITVAVLRGIARVAVAAVRGNAVIPAVLGAPSSREETATPEVENRYVPGPQ